MSDDIEMDQADLIARATKEANHGVSLT